jgi:hypothetical protein
LRLSVAAFDGAASLDLARQTLAQQNIEPIQCLVMSSTTDGDDLKATGIALCGRPVLATDPVVAGRLLEASGPLAFIREETTSLLQDHDFLLVLLAEDVRQHLAAVRILLKHADSRVYTSGLRDDRSGAMAPDEYPSPPSR